MKSLFESRSRIIAAIGFDDYSMDLVKSSEALARKTGKALTLVHVVEPWMESSHSRPFTHVSPLWDVTQAIEKNASDLAMQRLDEMKEGIKSIEVQTRVFTGVPADVLIAEATANDGAMIVVGTGRSTNRFIPGGFSTAFSLMSNSPVPVFVLHQGQTFEAKDELKILLADDLSASGERAVDFSFDLAASLRKTEFHHVHIDGMTVEALAAGIDTARASSHSSITDSLSAEEIFKSVQDKLMKVLESRGVGKAEYVEAADGTYKTVILNGVVGEELHRYAEEFDPDLLVFGRHHTIHKRPFMLGNVPFRAMLAEHRPFIVVPDDQ